MLNFRKIMIAAAVAAMASFPVSAAETEELPSETAVVAVEEAEPEVPADASPEESASEYRAETDVPAAETDCGEPSAQNGGDADEYVPAETSCSEENYVDVRVADPIQTEEIPDIEIEVMEHPTEETVFETELVDSVSVSDEESDSGDVDERNWRWSGDDELFRNGSLVLVSGDGTRALTFSWLKKSLPYYVETVESEPEIRNVLDWKCEEMDLQDGADMFSWLSASPSVHLNPVLDDDSDLFPFPTVEVSLSQDGRDEEGSKYEWTCEMRPGGWKIIRNVRYLIENQAEAE